MQPVPEALPTITADLEALWQQDPEAVPRTILDNEARQGELYRVCAARHSALVKFVSAQP